MRMRSNEACWCGSKKKLKRCHLERSALVRPEVYIAEVTAMRTVPDTIVRPPYVGTPGPSGRAGFQIQDDESLERLRHACQVAAEVLVATAAIVAPGVTTDDLDALAHEVYLSHGAYPSTLGYRGFPKGICTSVNEVVCHGIPDGRPLAEGDIVNIDVTAYIDGMHGDTSATIAVGEVTPEMAALIDTTRRATLLGIAAIAPGRPMKVIAEAIEPYAHRRGYGVIREYGGHGIGETFHADPHVNHVVDRRDRGVLQHGMTLTVEPMLTTGTPVFSTADDEWTEILDDAMPSAQFEHTIVVTATGAEILTVTASGETPAGLLPVAASV